MTEKKRAGRKSPYSRPDYHPPESSRQGFKNIVAHMQSTGEAASLREIAKRFGVTEYALTLYMDAAAGKIRISDKVLEQIEQEAEKL